MVEWLRDRVGRLEPNEAGSSACSSSSAVGPLRVFSLDGRYTFGYTPEREELPVWSAHKLIIVPQSPEQVIVGSARDEGSHLDQLQASELILLIEKRVN